MSWFKHSLRRAHREIYRNRTPRLSENVYFDLTPSSNLERDDEYTIALNRAFSNSSVINVALSGPYGSGKSSIISGYQALTKLRLKIVSLASFDLRNGKRSQEPQADSVDEIEKSILQHLLYSVSAEAIPESRFKRIGGGSVRSLLAKSACIALWLIACVHLYHVELFPLEYSSVQKGISTLLMWDLANSQSTVFNAISILIALSGLILGIKAISSLGLSSFKVSTPFIEAESSSSTETSVFSLYIDEILYFFERNSYDAVVFEDLDRFQMPEIFQRLREIALLVNTRRHPANNVKFIYSVRDDLFTGSDRAKFFDLIIPVIPIINTTNSYEKFVKSLEEAGVRRRIGDEFLREMSLHMNDMRILKNITNEISLYLSKLDGDGFECTRLAAVIFYKNYYSDDFAKLHDNDGLLHRICKSKGELLKAQTTKIREQITQLQNQILEIDRERLASLDELVSIYRAALNDVTIEHGGAPFQSVYAKGLSFTQLRIPETLETIFDGQTITVSNSSGSRCEIPIAAIEKSSGSKVPYKERKRAIISKAKNDKNEISKEISALNIQLDNIISTPLHILLRENPNKLKKIIYEYEKLEITDENADKERASTAKYALLRNLLLSGFLDENYADYISYFHAGKLQRNDRAFLLAVRSGLFLQEDAKVETPSEVVSQLQPHDFESMAIINFDLLRYVLQNSTELKVQTQKAVGYLATNFGRYDEFLLRYYRIVQRPTQLTAELLVRWDLLEKMLVSSPNRLQHMVNFISDLSRTGNIVPQGAAGAVRQYVAESSHDLESHIEGTEHHALYQKLDVKVRDLKAVREHDRLFQFLCRHNLYALSLDNIVAILNRDLTDGRREIDLTSTIYSDVENCTDDSLKNYIATDRQSFVEQIAKHFEIISESAETIHQILNNKEIHDETKSLLISKCALPILDLSKIPNNFIINALELRKAEATWKNLEYFVESEVYDDGMFEELLNDSDFVSDLTNTTSNTSLSGRAPEKLAVEIIENFSITPNNYRSLLSGLGYRWVVLPSGLPPELGKLYIETKTASLSGKTFAYFSNDHEALFSLIMDNLPVFEDTHADYDVPVTVKAKLLAAVIPISMKQLLVDSTDDSIANASRAYQLALAQALLKDEISPSSVSTDLALKVLNASTKTTEKLAVLLLFAPKMTHADFLIALGTMPSPYSEIGVLNKRPKLSIDEPHRQLLSHIIKFGMVSTSKERNGYFELNNKRK